MAINVIGVTTAVDNGSLTKPTSSSSDVLIAVAYSFGSSATITEPTGWTELARANDSSQAVTILSANADVASTALSGFSILHLYGLSGVDQTTPVVEVSVINAYADNGLAVPPIITVDAGNLIIAGAASFQGDNGAGYPNPSPYTAGENTLNGSNFRLASSYYLQPSTGSSPSSGFQGGEYTNQIGFIVEVAAVAAGATVSSSGDPATYTTVPATGSAQLRVSGAPIAYSNSAVAGSAQLRVSGGPTSFTDTVSAASAQIRVSGAPNSLSVSPIAASVSINVSGGQTTYANSPVNATSSITAYGAPTSYTITSLDGTGVVNAGAITINSSGDPALYSTTRLAGTAQIRVSGGVNAYAVDPVAGSVRVSISSGPTTYTVIPVAATGDIVGYGEPTAYTITVFEGQTLIDLGPAVYLSAGEPSAYAITPAPAVSVFNIDPANITLSVVYTIAPELRVAGVSSESRTLVLDDMAGNAAGDRVLEIAPDSRTLTIIKRG